MALAGKLVSPYKDFGEALGEGNLRGNLGGYLFLYTMFQLGEETCKYLDSNCTTSTAQLQSAAVLSAWSASTQLIASNQLPGATGNVAFQQLNTEFPMSAVAALTNRGIQSWIRERELLGNSTDNWEAWIPTLATGGIIGLLAVRSLQGASLTANYPEGSLMRSFLIGSVFTLAAEIQGLAGKYSCPMPGLLSSAAICAIGQTMLLGHADTPALSFRGLAADTTLQAGGLGLIGWLNSELNEGSISPIPAFCGAWVRHASPLVLTAMFFSTPPTWRIHRLSKNLGRALLMASALGVQQVILNSMKAMHWDN